MSGCVEVVQSTEVNGDPSADTEGDRSLTVDMDESLILDCAPHDGSLTAPAGAVNGQLHFDRARVRGCRLPGACWLGWGVGGGVRSHTLPGPLLALRRPLTSTPIFLCTPPPKRPATCGTATAAG
jgi:hypothetical protein